MTEFLSSTPSSEVRDAWSFARFAQETIGTPIPYGKDIAVLQRKLNDFFSATPKASWGTLVHTVEYCRAKRKRPALAWGILAQVRWAWAEGILPELDPTAEADTNLEWHIARALETETDPRWRRMLIGACGLENRRATLNAWYRHAGL